MSKRVSHSLLDPYVTTPTRSLYSRLRIPQTFPPEGIVLIGHLCAIAAAISFAYSTQFWWAGLLVAMGVAANHVADVLDGTHARATGQCRNGGELLDHFVDPLSFSYWLVGLSVCCRRLDLAIIAVICLHATAVLTNIKAKMIGEFTLARFGPTEFKALLVTVGIVLSVSVWGDPSGASASAIALWFLYGLIAVGIVQLAVTLIRAVADVNASGAAPDTTEWETTQSSQHDVSGHYRRATVDLAKRARGPAPR